MRLSALQAVGRLGPAHRTAHGVAHHGVEPRMKFCDRPGKALAVQLGSRSKNGSRRARTRASVPILHMFVRFFRNRRHHRHRCHPPQETRR